jgi:Flagellar hook-length control protein FliK
VSVEAALLALPAISAPPSSGAPPGPAPPGAPPFQSALAEHWARTANAEGQQQQGAQQSDTAGSAVGGSTSTAARHRHASSNAASEAGTPAVAAANAVSPSSSTPEDVEVSSEEAPATIGSGAAIDSPGSSTAEAPAVPALPGEAGEAAMSSPGQVAGSTQASAAAETSQAQTPLEGPVRAESPERTASPSASTLARELASSSPSTAQGQGASPAPTGKPQISADTTPAGEEAASAPATTTTSPAQPPATTMPAPAPVSGTAPPAGHVRTQSSTASSGREEASLATGSTDPTHTQLLDSHTGGEDAKEGEAGGQESNAAQSAPATASSQSQAVLEGSAASASTLTSALGEPLSVAPPALSSSTPVMASAAGGGAVELQQMIESIHATVELAARQGASQARISLQPRELGEIRIHLSQTSDGLLARVTADSAAAAQTLAGGRSELQQSLSTLGVSLLRLDIGSSGQPQTGEREGGFAGEPERSSVPKATEGTEESSVEQIGSTATVGGLDSGGLVDVLA